MSSLPSQETETQEVQEGLIPFSSPLLPQQPSQTYFKLIGDLSSTKTPVIMLHGGPGAGHGVLSPFTQLWQSYGIPVIFYDQIGCGHSTHFRDKAGDHEFWREELFVAELENLIQHFGLADGEGKGYDVLGFSWGAMLASAFAAKRPKGLRRLVLASGCASMELAQRAVVRWKDEGMDAEGRRVIDRAIETGEFSGEEYMGAMGRFQRLVLCRAEPFPPPEMVGVRKNQMDDPTVNKTMLGPTNFTNTGSLRGWTVIPRLPNIAVPTLVYNGEFDSSDDDCCRPFFDLIPKVRWTTIQGAAHMCHLESPAIRERVLRLVGDFLNHESTAPSTDSR